MVPFYFVIDQISGKEVPVTIRKATANDFAHTHTDAWQTDWTSAFIQDKKLLKYALELPETGELLGLGAYRDVPEGILIYVEYIESAPNSNPTLTHCKTYSGIGAALLARGVQLSIDYGYGGTIYLKAKTSDLRKHYIEHFGAIPFSNRDPFMLLIEGDAAKNLFFQYLKEE